MAWYVVREGDSIASIADANGLPAEAIWDDSQNADLKKQRPDPNVLAAGDAVFIPERKSTAKSAATDARHSFRIKRPLVDFSLKLANDGEPMADVAYRLEIDGKFYPPEGDSRTGADGLVKAKVPVNAKVGTLILSGLGRSFAIRLSHLEPVDVERGLRARLQNLGLLPGEDEPSLREAVSAFQAANGLTVTGTPDDTTRAKLREIHGS